MSSRLDASYAVLRRTGVPDGWREKQVSSLAQIVGGGTPDRAESSYWRDGKIPWITPTDLTANRGRYIRNGAEHLSETGLANSNAQLVPVGSIVFSTRGTVGNLAIAAVPLATNQSCEVLIPIDGETNSEFVFYLLTYGMFAYHRLAGGTTFGSITRREIQRVYFAVPRIEDQTPIVRILDVVDTAIEQVQEAMVQARLLQRAILEDVFQRMKAAPKRLKEHITEVRYGTSQASSDRGWGNPVLRIPNVVGDQLSIDDLAFVDLRPIDVKRLALADGDLLIVRTNGNPGYVGRSAVFRKPDERTWVRLSGMQRSPQRQLLPGSRDRSRSLSILTAGLDSPVRSVMYVGGVVGLLSRG